MSDIIDKLRDRRSIDGAVIYVEMTEEVLDEAIEEIQTLRLQLANLRQVAGTASIDGWPTFLQIKNGLRNGQ